MWINQLIIISVSLGTVDLQVGPYCQVYESEAHIYLVNQAHTSKRQNLNQRENAKCVPGSCALSLWLWAPLCCGSHAPRPSPPEASSSSFLSFLLFLPRDWPRGAMDEQVRDSKILRIPSTERCIVSIKAWGSYKFWRLRKELWELT
jgi:hypothetical protein